MRKTGVFRVVLEEHELTRMCYGEHRELALINKVRMWMYFLYIILAMSNVTIVLSFEMELISTWGETPSFWDSLLFSLYIGGLSNLVSRTIEGDIWTWDIAKNMKERGEYIKDMSEMQFSETFGKYIKTKTSRFVPSCCNARALQKTRANLEKRQARPPAVVYMLEAALFALAFGFNAFISWYLSSATTGAFLLVTFKGQLASWGISIGLLIGGYVVKTHIKPTTETEAAKPLLPITTERQNS